MPSVSKSTLTTLGNQTTSTPNNSISPSGTPDASTGIYITTGASSGSGKFQVLIVPVGQGLLLVEAFPLNDVYATLSSLRNLEILVSGGVLLVLGIGGYYLVVLGLRPLEKVKHATREIAAGNLEKRVQIDSTKTEIGQLSLDFNEMIDRIEGEFKLRAATEARLRRFVSDASHELRTPLSFLRGHAELFRQGAVTTPEELAISMKRIEEQAKRMGRLVDELLLLARFDEGSPIVLAPIDLRLIAHDAAADARAMAPERNVKVSAVEEVLVMAEETGLRQVVGNMVRNALVHTPPGTPIELEVTKTEGTGIVKVIDFGPGIAPDTAQSIFDRFYRADPSRSRDSGGSGLGLAIVATIIQAYGGTFGVLPTVDSDNEPSNLSGATFWVSLPLKTN
ncbi:MAG: HAMP domain-containing histidine kinase [Acidimicrobiales bacterium]|nr:HAMP domain-containing histidine kinase [Acidimicrobiales bacterium]